MSTALGIGKKLEDFMLHTEVFDTPGSAVFNHPNPGQALDVIVTLIGAGGGGGGGANDGIGPDASDGTAGGDSIWDTGGTPVTALGGGAGLGGQDTADQGFRHASQSYIKYPVIPATVSDNGTLPLSNGTPYGAPGRYGYSGGYSGGMGGIGFVKTFTQTITGNINLTVGAGGTGGAKQVGGPTSGDGQDGQNGAIIVQYAKASAGIPAPIAKEFVEEWIDKDRETADSGVWVHPNPGQAIEMTVIAIGGSGGNAQSSLGSNGTAGGNTTFGAITATGGPGGLTTGFSALNSNNIAGVFANGYGFWRETGYGIFGATNTPKGVNNSSFYSGAPGSVKISKITVTGNVNYSIGNGGTEGNTDIGDGLPGGIILKYSK